MGRFKAGLVLAVVGVVVGLGVWRSYACAERQITGFHVDFVYRATSTYPALITLLRDTRSKIQRSTMAWSVIEATQGVQDWSRPDAAVSQLNAAGIESVFFFGCSPQWVNGSSNCYTIPTGGAFTTFVSRWATFAGQAVNRYKTQGVHKWEIWNEPNLEGFWAPPPVNATSVANYITLYNAMKTAILTADPTAQVAMASMSGGCCTASTSLSGFAYFQEMLNQGAGPNIDIVNIHPYPTQNQAPNVTIPFENNFTDIATYHTMMVNNGLGNKPLWVTEWGWNVNVTGTANQSTYVGQSLNMLQNLYPYVTLATYFWIQDDSGGSFPYGVYTSSGVARPAATTFRNRTN